ncbi:MobV family relaxase [Hymenobacter volaticus]|uniref:Plasmid recombination protein n=1 Tax=Hymenobacter volaticus TaxID=2932254 RepID=A0ABY4GFG0_9BACT|nr:MobV family relaxase [Hymenobacter volaticus]UOQ69229.1 plasmid recombination protein [Hymenobacter volaticus]
MAYAILRISKLTSRDMATSATLHNYRGQDTPNADPLQFARNEELLNHRQRNYWELATERINELQLPRLRKDAVRAVEVLLTASSEAFPRDAKGHALDCRGSQWVKDNIAFLQDKFGIKNVVSCTLHQDEITPHIHAVVVPITNQPRLVKGEPVGADVRLSCRDVFSPVSLRQLQTEYAQAMAPHGLERGIKYSTAIHQDVRRHYGAQKTTQQELAELSAPLAYQSFELEPMKLKDQLSPQAYLNREQARMNHYLAEQVAAVNAKLAEVATIAAANTLALDRARVLEKQLAKSKEQQQQTASVLAQKTQQLVEKEQQLVKQTTRVDHLLMAAVQGDTLNPKLLERAQQQREQSRQRAENVVTGCLRGPITNGGEVGTILQQSGYTLHKTADEQLQVRDTQTQARFPLSDLRPNGQELWISVQQAVKRTQDEQEQARREEIAKDPRALHAIIGARDAEQADRIQQDLEKVGATVWQVRKAENERIELRVSYRFDWNTIEQISHTLDKVKRSLEVTLEESYAHQSSRTSAVRTAERERDHQRTERHPDRGRGM